VAPETEGEEESDHSEEEKGSGIDISEASPPPSSKLENANDQQQAFDDYLKNWGAKLNA